jgi:hypothetical protein
LGVSNSFPVWRYSRTLTICNTDSPVHDRAHFAVAIIVNPWNCLSEGNEVPTSVLYMDSIPSGTPLASSDLISKAIVEWDAIRQGKAVNEPVDLALARDAGSRVKFISVKVSQPSNKF